MANYLRFCGTFSVEVLQFFCLPPCLRTYHDMFERACSNMFEHDMTCSNRFEHGYTGQLRLYYTTTHPLLGDVFEAPYLQMLENSAFARCHRVTGVRQSYPRVGLRAPESDPAPEAESARVLARVPGSNYGVLGLVVSFSVF